MIRASWSRSMARSMPTARSSTGSRRATPACRLIGLHVLGIVSIEARSCTTISGIARVRAVPRFLLQDARGPAGARAGAARRLPDEVRARRRGVRHGAPSGDRRESSCDQARIADLVIVGHRRVNEQFSTGLLGGTTESSRARAPARPRDPLEFKEIGRPLPGVRRLAARRRRAARLGGGRVGAGPPLTVIHVAKDNGADGDRVLAEAQRYLQSYELPVTIKSSPGPPAAHRRRAARRRLTTLLFIGRTATRGSSRWSSAAHRVRAADSGAPCSDAR